MTSLDLRPILIAGPTASGKSALAVALAQAVNGLVINADSMQVYRELAIVTARPTAADLELAPHALYGHVSAAQAYSTGRWTADLAPVLELARTNRQRPIIVGGTGLYFKALTEGLSPIPEIPDAIRKFWRERAARLGSHALHAELEVRDPVMADRLSPGDSQRVIRAHEVLEATGRSLRDWQSVAGVPLIRPSDAVALVLAPERALSAERLSARFDAMIAMGALDEVRALMALGLDPGLPAMVALGVRPLLAHLKNTVSLADAIGQAKLETSQYVKRQMTWFKRNMIAWKLYDQQFSEYLLEEIIHFVSR